MLTKLAFKNVGKSLREYAVYFFTLVFGVCVFYMFNSIYAQQKIMVVTETVNESMIALRTILSYISVFVAIVLGFLIVYANNFFIKRRKKELGIYMTLGIEKKSISVILVLETSLMALVALIVGLFAGVFLSQFMSVFTAKIFEADMESFQFVFAPAAAGKSILYFGIIFLIVIIFNTFAISKFKLIDLLYGGRKNESLKVKSVWFTSSIFTVSIGCLIASYILILKNGIININFYFLASIVLGCMGTLLFFLSLAGFLTKLMQANKKRYFKNLNMFIFRQLSSKINTNFISVSVVCIVLLLTIGIFSCGYSMQNALSNNLRNDVNYDYSFHNYNYGENVGENIEPIYNNLPDEVKDSGTIDQYFEISLYQIKDTDVWLTDFPITWNEENQRWGMFPLVFISNSDYNKALKLLGKEEIGLTEGQYAILANGEGVESVCNQLIEKNQEIEIENKKLLPMSKQEVVSIDNDSQYFYIIVPDEIVKNMKEKEKILNIQCINEEANKEFQRLIDKNIEESNLDSLAFVYCNSKQEIYAASISTKAIISYLAIYLGIVFMITCAAILAIQQLSEAADNKERYMLLKKLGADKEMLNKALFIQIACYFLFPLMLAIVHSIVGLKAANEVIQRFGKMDIVSSIIATGVFVMVVYGTYFIITYVGSKNIINKG